MIYAFLADGFEEIEAIAPIDILRRCGLEVVTVGIGDTNITGAHGITVETDINELDIIFSEKIDMILLPGGMPGTLNLEKSLTVNQIIDFCANNDKYIAAICAAPSILGKKNLLTGRKATCFPGFEQFLYGAVLADENEKVCVDGKFITASSAGVALEFGFKLAELLEGEPKAHSVKASMQCNF